MKFKSRTEAYTYTIWKIIKLDHQYLTDEEAKSIDKCLLKIIDLMDKHENDSGIFLRLLDYLKKRLSNVLDIQTFEAIQKIFLNSDFSQTAQEKFENPLGRRYESEIGIALMLNPTDAMMSAVGKVSVEILKILDEMNDSGTLTERLIEFSRDFHLLSFGAFEKPPSVTELKEILANNQPHQLIEIMFIHFRFGQFFFPYEPINNAQVRMPVGELKNIVRELYWYSDLSGFFAKKLVKRISPASSKELTESLPPINPRTYIADVKFYKSPLYTVLRDRGRSGPVENSLTNQMGLMLLNQTNDEEGLPTHSSFWTADCKFQQADFTSQYVKDLIDNDSVYIAGPSGMTGVLLGQMEILANFETLDLKQNYLSSVVAYMISGGFHSLHEVIGPAEFILRLVPGYNIQIPVQDTLAAPPNFDVFFKQQERIDSQFRARMELGFESYLQYFDDDYLSLRMPFEHLKLIITQKLDIYLRSHSIDLSNLKFVHTKDPLLARAKLAFEYRLFFYLSSSLEEIKEILMKMERKNLNLSPPPTSGFFSPIENSLETIIEELILLCEDFEKKIESQSHLKK